MGTRTTGVPMTACGYPERSSPSRWRFCPLSPLTFRFRVRPSGGASTYSRSVLGASRNLCTHDGTVKRNRSGFGALCDVFSDRVPAGPTGALPEQHARISPAGHRGPFGRATLAQLHSPTVDQQLTSIRSPSVHAGSLKTSYSRSRCSVQPPPLPRPDSCMWGLLSGA